MDTLSVNHYFRRHTNPSASIFLFLDANWCLFWCILYGLCRQIWPSSHSRLLYCTTYAYWQSVTIWNTHQRFLYDRKTLEDRPKNFQSSYDKMEIKYVAYIRSQFNISDSLTKIKTNSILLIFIRNSVLDDPIQQFIVRRKHLIQLSTKRGC